MNRSIPTQQPWVALGSPATQEFYALVRNYGVKRMVRLNMESLYTVMWWNFSFIVSLYVSDLPNVVTAGVTDEYRTV